MIAEIFTLLANTAADQKGLKQKFGNINLNRRKIRSISSFSSNSIFYFNCVVSDQAMPEEVTMVSRALEKSYASFVVACIGLMPFHRIKADDRGAIEDYLTQFHQNVGINAPSDGVARAIGTAYRLGESVGDDEALRKTQDFLMECWEVAKRKDLDFIHVVSETVSLNDMFNVDPVDPVTKVIQEQFKARLDELDSWGFIGEATAEMFDDYFDDDEYDYDDDDYDEDDLDDEYPELDDLLGEASGEDGDALDEWNQDAARAKLDLKAAKLYAYDRRGDVKASKLDTDRARFEHKSAKMDVKAARQAYREAKRNGKYGGGDDFGNSDYTPKSRNIKKVTMSVKKKGQNNDAAPDMHEFDEAFLKGATGADFSTFGKNFGEKMLSNSTTLKALNGDSVSASASLSEGSVKGAVNSIMFSLESVSENKIANCQSLTKLASMEAKLNKLKGKYAKYLNRYKHKYEENKKKGTNAKLQMKFNGELISNPKEFMQQYGEYIKIINRRLKAVEKRRAQLRKRKGLPDKVKNESIQAYEADLTDLDFEIVDMCNESISAQLNAPEEEIFILDEAAPGRGPKDPFKNTALAGSYRETHPMGAQVPINSAERDPKTKRITKTNMANYKIDNKMFTDMEMKKANEAIPTFAKATIGFIIDDTEEVVNRDILVGIKVLMHAVPAQDLINDLYNAIINKRKFLRFVKWYSGEEKSLADLLFGFKELRTDALNSRSGSASQWTAAFRQRKRWAKMSVPYLMKEHTPNGTVILTMNEVQFIKDEYGVDIMRPDHIKMLMDQSFLLGFVVLDQANELVHITYDGHNGNFQQYTYAAMERDSSDANNARFIREMYRTMAR